MFDFEILKTHATNQTAYVGRFAIETDSGELLCGRMIHKAGDGPVAWRPRLYETEAAARQAAAAIDPSEWRVETLTPVLLVAGSESSPAVELPPVDLSRLIVLIASCLLMSQSLAAASPLSVSVEFTGGISVAGEFVPAPDEDGTHSVSLGSGRQVAATWHNRATANSLEVIVELESRGVTAPGQVSGRVGAEFTIHLDKKSRTFVRAHRNGLSPRGTSFTESCVDDPMPDGGEPGLFSSARFPVSYQETVDLSPAQMVDRRGDERGEHGEEFLRDVSFLHEHRDQPAGTCTYSIVLDVDGESSGRHRSITFQFVRFVPGDVDRSGRFDQLDVVRLLQWGNYLGRQTATNDGNPFRQSETRGVWSENVDFVGPFNQLDVIAALSEGDYLKGAYTAQVVPEPITATMLAIGLCFLFGGFFQEEMKCRRSSNNPNNHACR
jgi:hypothetical protein